jgi:integrase
LNNTTIAKLLSTLKTFLGYAKRRGVIINPDYKDYRIVRQELEVIALTQEELNRLFLCDLSNDRRLAKVRDVFCFSCFTGLRYSDLKQLRWEHIKSSEIVLTITKTKSRLSIPLSDYSSAILDKYKQAGRPLPVISSQNMNYALKELGELVGIDEQIEIVRYRGAQRVINVYPKHRLLTVHTGRKTFATLSLERGMSAEETMSVTGHSDYKSFKRYVRITEERKKLVMNRAWGAPETII